MPNYCSRSNDNYNQYGWDELSEVKFKKAMTMPWIQDQLYHLEKQIDTTIWDNSLSSNLKVNKITNEFTNIMTSVGEISLKRKRSFHTKKKKVNKKWFDTDCYELRKDIKSLNALNRQPFNQHLRQKYFSRRKEYNKLIKQKKRSYKNILVNKLNDALNEEP